MESTRFDPATGALLLTDEQRALLTAVLNHLIPAHAALPGAGDLGVGDTIEQGLGATGAARRLLLDGLVQIDLISARRAGGDFVSLAADHQEAVLREIERAEPGFFATLVERAYRGYYSLPAVQAAIGFPGHPPQPLGHHLAPFDPALLDRQRQRAPFWRRTS